MHKKGNYPWFLGIISFYRTFFSCGKISESGKIAKLRKNSPLQAKILNLSASQILHTLFERRDDILHILRAVVLIEGNTHRGFRQIFR